MKRKIGCVILSLMMFLSLWACGQKSGSVLDWQGQYDLGVRYLSEGNYEEAILAFTAAIEIDPKQAPAYVGRGDAYRCSGTTDDLTAAQSDYETALSLDNTLAEAWLGSVETCILQEDYEKAEQVLEQAIEAVGPEKLQEKMDEKKQDGKDDYQGTKGLLEQNYGAVGDMKVNISLKYYMAAEDEEEEYRYFYNAAGYLVREEHTYFMSDGITQNTTGWNYVYTGPCDGEAADCLCVPDRENYGSEEEWEAGKYETFQVQGPFNLSSIGDLCTSPQTMEKVGEDGILENWNDSPDPNVAPHFDHAEYTFDEEGYPIHIVTYAEDGSEIGHCDWEWAFLSEVAVEGLAYDEQYAIQETTAAPDLEPGSDAFLRAAEEHLDPAVDFDFAIGGVILAGADMETVAGVLGGRLENQGGDLCVWATPAGAMKFGWSSIEGVDIITLLSIPSEKSQITIWPSEYFARIAATDTLEQALEKLGFTEEERAYLATCSGIGLHYYPDNVGAEWRLSVSPAGTGTAGMCGLNIYGDGITYGFTYSMYEVVQENGVPVDGRAELTSMDINYH